MLVYEKTQGSSKLFGRYNEALAALIKDGKVRSADINGTMYFAVKK